MHTTVATSLPCILTSTAEFDPLLPPTSGGYSPIRQRMPRSCATAPIRQRMPRTWCATERGVLGCPVLEGKSG